jgi:lysozyme family protein
MTDFAAAFRRVIKRRFGDYPHRIERGVDHMFGITQRHYIMWRSDNHLGWADVLNISRDELQAFYLEHFWRAACCDDLPPEVREIHLDTAVCHHPRRAALMLQQAARVEERGGIGPQTLSAVHAVAPSLLYARYLAIRYAFYGEILARDHDELPSVCDWFAGLSEFPA